MTGRLPEHATPFSLFGTLPPDRHPPHCSLTWLSGAFLATRCPSGDNVHSEYLLVTRLLGLFSHLAGRRIPSCSVLSWVFGTLLAVRPNHWGTPYLGSVFLVGLLHECRKSKVPACPECSYARHATAWDPLSDLPIGPVRSPSLTDWTGSQKCVESPREHQLARRSSGAQRPGGHRVAKMSIDR